MTYQVKTESEIGELEVYGPTFPRKADAVRFARYAAKNSVLTDVTRFHVDHVERDCGVASFPSAAFCIAA